MIRLSSSTSTTNLYNSFRLCSIIRTLTPITHYRSVQTEIVVTSSSWMTGRTYSNTVFSLIGPQQQKQQQQPLQYQQQRRSLSSNSEERRYFNPADVSSATAQQYGQQQQQQNSDDKSTSQDVTQQQQQRRQQQRSPFVLTNMKSPTTATTGSNNNYYNRVAPNAQQQQQQSSSSLPSTSSIIAAQIPRILSRLTILKHRHANLLLSSKNKNQQQQQQQQQATQKILPPLSNLFTNFNHGSTFNTNTNYTNNNNDNNSNNNSTTRLFSTSLDDVCDTEIVNEGATTPTKPSNFVVLLYAVYGKRDFMEIQRTNYTESLISSKVIKTMMEEQDDPDETKGETTTGDAVVETSTNATTDASVSDITPTGTEQLNEKEKEEEDEDENSNEMVSFAMEADLYSLPDIQAAVTEQFGTCINLQYYHMGANEWRTLNDEYDLDLFQSFFFECVHIFKKSNARVVVPVRIPDYYVDDDDGEDPYNEDGTPKGLELPSSNFHTLEAMIEHLLQRLIESKWMCEEHHSEFAVPPPNTNTTSDTTTTSETTSSETTSSTTPTTTTKPKTKYRLMKEVTHDSSIDVLDGSHTHEVETTIPTENIITSSSTTTKTVTESLSTDTMTVTGLTSATNTTTDNEKFIGDELVSETTTIMPTEERPTLVKHFMFMNTKDYVLSEASKDAALRGLLFYYPHALDHIVECLHYKFLWDNYFLKDLVPATGDEEHIVDDVHGEGEGDGGDHGDEDGREEYVNSSNGKEEEEESVTKNDNPNSNAVN